MDTLNVGRSLWRNRFLVGPVLLLTLLGLVWVFFFRPVTYQVQSSLLLVPPPPAPTAADIEKDPSLAGLNADNPYGRSYDPTILIALVSTAIQSESGRAAVGKAGGDEKFTVVQTTRYGFNSPFADIVSAGSSPEQAIRSNELVIAGFEKELAALQLKEKVSKRYLITTRVAGDPSTAKVRTSDVGRVLLGVIGLGILGLFTVVSAGDALREIRREAQ